MSLRVGIVGCGAVADFGHIPAVLSTPEMELVGVFDPNIERARAAIHGRSSARVAATEEDLYALGLDAVVICSPPKAHFGNLRLAASHGCHVLCEKPLAESNEDAEEMASIAHESGIHLVTGFVYRFSPVARQIKRWVEEGVVGKVRAMRLVYLWNLHGQYEQDPSGRWIESPRWRGRMLEGGPLVDCGVHQIDLTRWWTGEEIVSGSASGAWVADYEAPDHVTAHLTTESGISSMVDVSFSYGHTARDPAPIFTYELIGDGGVIRYDRNGWLLEVRNGGGNHVAPGGSEKDFQALHAAFASAIQSGDISAMPNARDGIIATRIATELTREIIDRKSGNAATFGTYLKVGEQSLNERYPRVQPLLFSALERSRFL